MAALGRRSGIRLVISDVDGTLLARDKRLRRDTVRAVAALHEAGIHFALASSRPPRGMAMLLKPLRVRMPLCAFNGGLILAPMREPLHAAPLSAAAASAAIRFLEDCGIETRVFDAQHWYVRDPHGIYACRERATIRYAPRVVPDLQSVRGRAFKVVGASADHARLAQCERALKALLGDAVAVTRSRPHYIDITHRRAHKGRFVHALSRLLSIPHSAIAAIGDGANDLPMFGEAGLSIAMGNADEAVKAAARAVTGSNAENGFAAAVERYILGVGAARLAS